jgi:hypothetical protein
MYTNTYTHIWQKYFDAGPLFPKEKENEKDDSAAAAVRASHPPSCLTPYALRLMPYAYTDARVAPALPPALRLMPYAYIDARVAAARHTRPPTRLTPFALCLTPYAFCLMPTQVRASQPPSYPPPPTPRRSHSPRSASSLSHSLQQAYADPLKQAYADPQGYGGDPRSSSSLSSVSHSLQQAYADPRGGLHGGNAHLRLSSDANLAL